MTRPVACALCQPLDERPGCRSAGADRVSRRPAATFGLDCPGAQRSVAAHTSLRVPAPRGALDARDCEDQDIRERS